MKKNFHKKQEAIKKLEKYRKVVKGHPLSRELLDIFNVASKFQDCSCETILELGSDEHMNSDNHDDDGVYSYC